MSRSKPVTLDGKTPLICVPLIGKTNEEILKQAIAAEEGTDRRMAC